MATGVTWAGWEYETRNGLHMVESKRHLFPLDGYRPGKVALCGAQAPFEPSKHVGRDVCRKCQRIEDRSESVK